MNTTRGGDLFGYCAADELVAAVEFAGPASRATGAGLKHEEFVDFIRSARQSLGAELNEF
jgi:hypothetical protein